MSIKQAVLADTDLVKKIAEETISAIYPHYYPKGAVDFFLNHHSEAKISTDIKLNRVFLCLTTTGNAVGTVTIKDNEICRLFVLPAYQCNGYGTEMLDFAERVISHNYGKIVVAASLPAKRMYQNRGYKDREFNIIPTGHNDYLCYDVMEKQI